MVLAALRRRDTPVADLARVLACWMAVILLAQGLAALQALVRGPAHRHLAVSSAPEWAPTVHATTHALSHALGEAHHHAADEVAVPAGTEAGLDAAACVLMAALAALAVSYGWAASAARGGRAMSVSWALAENEPSPPRRPPRR
jgi:hypothetical protein